MCLHTYQPTPVLLELSFIQIHWYGFLIVLAIVVNFFSARFLFKKYQLPLDLLFDLGFYLIFFGLIGARLWHVLNEIGYYWYYPMDIFKIWQGGLAIHGAVFGGIITLWFYLKQKKLGIFILLLDLLVPLVILGQAIGRWGNYFNQELYGRPVEWGIPINSVHRLPGYEQFSFFHPIFLYESLWCLGLFGFLLFMHQTRIKGSQSASGSQTVNNFKFKILNFKSQIIKLPGTIFFAYLFLYSLERFFIGFLRIDQQANWLNLRLDQWTSLILIFISIIGWLFILKRNGALGQSS